MTVPNHTTGDGDMENYMKPPERNGNQQPPRRVTSEIEREAAESHRHCDTGKFDAVTLRALYQDARRELEQEGARMLEELTNWRRARVDVIQQQRAGLAQQSTWPGDVPLQIPPT